MSFLWERLGKSKKIHYQWCSRKPFVSYFNLCYCRVKGVNCNGIQAMIVCLWLYFHSLHWIWFQSESCKIIEEKQLKSTSNFERNRMPNKVFDLMDSTESKVKWWRILQLQQKAKRLRRLFSWYLDQMHILRSNCSRNISPSPHLRHESSPCLSLQQSEFLRGKKQLRDTNWYACS